MTITEFLTARLDEEEAAAQGRDADAPIHQVGCYYYHQSIDPRQWTAEHCDCEESAKAYTLDDIAAKRAIVSACCEHTDEDAWERDRVAASDLAYDTLRHLASLYESHKDYDPAWRAG